MKDVKGKIVVITGGAMGMGRLLSIKFAQDGARLVLIDLNKEALEKTAAEFKKTGTEVHTYICDITDRKKVYEMAADVHKKIGKIDVLVNNAGVVWGSPFVEADDEKLFKTIDVNVNAVMWMMKAFLPDLYEKKTGHVINIASAAGLMGVVNLSAYCASKFAVVGMTEAIRQETKKKGLKDVKFTTVCPSFVATGMFEGVKPPKMTKWLTPEQMVDKIYAAFKKDAPLIREPLMVKFVPLIKSILPVNSFDRISHLLGTSRSMEKWVGRK
jgi:all-trans-retinol dehydrogenase (NAD+)